MRVLPLRHWLETRLARRELLHPAAWLGLFLGLEVLGRRSRSDTQDAIGVICVLAFTALTVFDHRRRGPVKMVDWVRDRLAALARRLGAWKIETGLDLRGDPPLPRAVPSWLRGVCLASVALLMGLVLMRAHLPEGLRHVALQVSPSLWFTFLAFLWTFLVLGTFALLAVPLPQVHDKLQSSELWSRRPPWLSEFWLFAFYFVAVSAIALLLPGWFALAVAGLSFVLPVLLLMLPGNPRLSFCWRESRREATETESARPAGSVHAVDWTEAIQGPAIAMMSLLFSAILLARGSQLHDLEPSSMPVTTLLGWLFSWSVAVASLAEARVKGAALLAARFRDPARGARIEVRLREAAGAQASKAERRSLVEALGEPRTARLHVEGAKSRKGRVRPADCEVELLLDDRATRDDWRWASSWPLRVAPEALRHPELHERVRRRHEILSRRRLFRGLERLFKAAARRRYERGTGFWVCPHLWAISGLHRDVDEDTTWSIGPPFHRVMPLASRAHLHRVLRGLEIDLVFVEDGVGFRRARRVFAMMFELHDIFGGGKRAEDQHFSGLPGVRVLLHELDFDRPFESEGYPEPDYQEIGRARILHVFRDRGGETERELVPRIPDHVPDFAPVLV